MGTTVVIAMFTRAYLTIWATTLLAAVVAWPLGATARQILSARLTPHHLDASAPAILELASHNLLVASLPLWLVGIGAATSDLGRLMGDVLIGGTCLINTALVGGALGGYGMALVPYVPHLPLEWAVLGCTGTGWLVARESRESRVPVPLVAVAVVLAILAATVELRLTPSA